MDKDTEGRNLVKFVIVMTVVTVIVIGCLSVIAEWRTENDHVRKMEIIKQGYEYIETGSWVKRDGKSEYVRTK